MKGVITAAGLGSRSGLDGKMRKEMLPVYDVRKGRLVLRPIIDVLISKFRENGILEIAVVLDPKDRWTREYIETEFPETEIIFQEEKLGYGHAVLMAREFVGENNFILNAGDGLVLRDGVISELVSWKSDGVFLTLMTVPNPERYGTAEIQLADGKPTVKGVVEKSKTPPSNFALCALYRLPFTIFDHLEKLSGKNMELTPSIDALIKSGVITKATVIDKKEWVSVGRAEAYIEVLRSTLEKCRQ